MCTTLDRYAVAVMATGLLAALGACDREVAGPEVSPTGSTHARIGVASVPVNDDFDDAIVVTDVPFTDMVNTLEATTADDDPVCVGQGPTVWYTFTAPADGSYEANTFGSDFDTTLGAYSGARGSLVELACNDDASGLLSRVVLELAAGETVHYMVGGFSPGEGGNLVFNLQVESPPPPPLEGGVTIDRIGSFDPRSGSATISGTLACSRPAYVELYVVLSDRIGRIRVEASSGGFYFCEGSTPFEVQITPQNAYLVGGPANIFSFAYFYDPNTGEMTYTETETTVRLRGRPASRGRPSTTLNPPRGGHGMQALRPLQEVMPKRAGGRLVMSEKPR